LTPFSAEGDRVRLALTNQKGTVVGTWFSEDGDEHWETAHGLQQEAQRATTGWDVALAELEDALESSGQIGESEDVPF